jgi:Spy/CpxP family protein refolding chaperone
MRNTHRLPAAVLTASLFVGVAGCNSGITPDLTLAEAAARIDIFNQLTVGDVIEGFQTFVDNVASNRGGFGFGVGLDDEQRVAIEGLQQQLDAGEIDRDEFSTQVRDVLGDAAPQLAFGGFQFFGGPFGHHFGGRVAFRLDLTEEQQTMARAIFMAAHEDIILLRITAHDDMRDVLTEEQRTQLDELRQPALFQRHFRHHRGGLFGGRFFDRLAEMLALTDEQITAIQGIRDQLRMDVSDRHQQARDEFRAILTEEQLAILDEIEARWDHNDDDAADDSSDDADDDDKDDSTDGEGA